MEVPVYWAWTQNNDIRCFQILIFVMQTQNNKILTHNAHDSRKVIMPVCGRFVWRWIGKKVSWLRLCQRLVVNIMHFECGTGKTASLEFELGI